MAAGVEPPRGVKNAQIDDHVPMADLIHTFETQIRNPAASATYEARAMGESRADGTWAGWLEFHPITGRGPVLRTERETTQPDRTALDYWAGGLEAVYLQGAFTRARRAD